jgi:hypothetical protein
MNFSINMVPFCVFIPVARNGPCAEGSVIARMMRLTCLALVMQAGLASAAMAGPMMTSGSLALSADKPAFPLQPQFRSPRASGVLAMQRLTDQAPENDLNNSNSSEILALKDDHRTTLKFVQLVVLPLSVCFALIFLLRRGFLT